MNKKLRMGMAAVAAGLILAGCGADFENPVPPVVQDEAVVETVALTVPMETEPAAMLPWVGEHRTPLVEHPRGYEVGTRVWIVRHNGCEMPAEVRERIVLAECGPYVIVFAPELADDDLKEQAAILLTQSELVGPCLELYNSGDAYRSQKEAQAVAEGENDSGY